MNEEVKESSHFKQRKEINENEKADPQFKAELEAKYEEYKRIMKTQESDLFSKEAKLGLMKEVLLLFG